MKKFNLNRKKIFATSMSLIALILVFIGGIFSPSTHIETIADYATNVVKTNTKSKNLCALTVGKTAESGQIPKLSTEFQNLYGVFRQEKITFASTINADKQHNIQIENVSSGNLSFLCCGGVGTIKYKNHYKHNMLPIEVMFPDERIYSSYRYVIYISQQNADILLENKGIQKTNDGYSLSEYETLLHSPIEVTIDGSTETFGVQNIFFQSNYYYSGVTEVVGDFAMISYYLPYNLMEEQCHMYFLSDYTYQNRYFMKYIGETYSSGKYSVKVNHYNLIDSFDEDYLLSFYYRMSDSKSNWKSISIFTLSGLLMLASVILAIVELRRNKNQSRLFDYFFYFIPLFIPYSIFLLLFKTTNKLIFMSEISAKMNGILILVYISLLLIFACITRIKSKNAKSNGKNSYYEIGI